MSCRLSHGCSNNADFLFMGFEDPNTWAENKKVNPWLQVKVNKCSMKLLKNTTLPAEFTIILIPCENNVQAWFFPPQSLSIGNNRRKRVSLKGKLLMAK